MGCCIYYLVPNQATVPIFASETLQENLGNYSDIFNNKDYNFNLTTQKILTDLTLENHSTTPSLIQGNVTNTLSDDGEYDAFIQTWIIITFVMLVISGFVIKKVSKMKDHIELSSAMKFLSKGKFSFIHPSMAGRQIDDFADG